MLSNVDNNGLQDIKIIFCCWLFGIQYGYEQSQKIQSVSQLLQTKIGKVIDSLRKIYDPTSFCILNQTNLVVMKLVVQYSGQRRYYSQPLTGNFKAGLDNFFYHVAMSYIAQTEICNPVWLKIWTSFLHCSGVNINLIFSEYEVFKVTINYIPCMEMQSCC